MDYSFNIRIEGTIALSKTFAPSQKKKFVQIQLGTKWGGLDLKIGYIPPRLEKGEISSQTT